MIQKEVSNHRKNQVGLEKTTEKIASDIGGRNGQMAGSFGKDAERMPFLDAKFFSSHHLGTNFESPPLW